MSREPNDRDPEEPRIEELARWGGCSNPGEASLGGFWLRSVREIYLELQPQLEADRIHSGVMLASRPRFDSMLWTVFAEIEAWRIDLDALCGYTEDMVRNAEHALTFIAAQIVDHFERERRILEGLESGL